MYVHVERLREVGACAKRSCVVSHGKWRGSIVQAPCPGARGVRELQRPAPTRSLRVRAWMMQRRQQTNAVRCNRQRRQKSWHSHRGSAVSRPCARRIRTRPHNDHDRGRTGRSGQVHVQRHIAGRHARAEVAARRSDRLALSVGGDHRWIVDERRASCCVTGRSISNRIVRRRYS